MKLKLSFSLYLLCLILLIPISILGDTLTTTNGFTTKGITLSYNPDRHTVTFRETNTGYEYGFPLNIIKHISYSNGTLWQKGSSSAPTGIKPYKRPNYADQTLTMKSTISSTITYKSKTQHPLTYNKPLKEVVEGTIEEQEIFQELIKIEYITEEDAIKRYPNISNGADWEKRIKFQEKKKQKLLEEIFDNYKIDYTGTIDILNKGLENGWPLPIFLSQ